MGFSLFSDKPMWPRDVTWRFCMRITHDFAAKIQSLDLLQPLNEVLLVQQSRACVQLKGANLRLLARAHVPIAVNEKSPKAKSKMSQVRSKSILTSIELDDGKIYRKTLYLMVKTMVSCRFPLKPIHWYKLDRDHHFLVTMPLSSRCNWCNWCGSNPPSHGRSHGIVEPRFPHCSRNDPNELRWNHWRWALWSHGRSLRVIN